MHPEELFCRQIKNLSHYNRLSVIKVKCYRFIWIQTLSSLTKELNGRRLLIHQINFRTFVALISLVYTVSAAINHGGTMENP